MELNALSVGMSVGRTFTVAIVVSVSFLFNLLVFFSVRVLVIRFHSC